MKKGQNYEVITKFSSGSQNKNNNVLTTKKEKEIIDSLPIQFRIKTLHPSWVGKIFLALSPCDDFSPYKICIVRPLPMPIQGSLLNCVRFQFTLTTSSPEVAITSRSTSWPSENTWYNYAVLYVFFFVKIKSFIVYCLVLNLPVKVHQCVKNWKVFPCELGDKVSINF